MHPVATDRAAARGQSDRPPCTNDIDDAGAPPCRRNRTTRRHSLAAARRVLAIRAAGVRRRIGKAARNPPLWHLVSIALAGGGVVLLLRLGVVSTDTPDRHGPAALVREPAPPARSTTRSDDRFFIYLVESSEEAMLLQSWFGGGRAPDVSPGAAPPNAVRVVASPEEAARFFDDLARINAVRVAAGLPEIQIVDLRAPPPR